MTKKEYSNSLKISTDVLYFRLKKYIFHFRLEIYTRDLSRSFNGRKLSRSAGSTETSQKEKRKSTTSGTKSTPGKGWVNRGAVRCPAIHTLPFRARRRAWPLPRHASSRAGADAPPPPAAHARHGGGVVASSIAQYFAGRQASKRPD